MSFAMLLVFCHAALYVLRSETGRGSTLQREIVHVLDAYPAVTDSRGLPTLKEDGLDKYIIKIS